VFLGGVLASLGIVSLPALLAIVVVAAVTGDAVGYLVGRRFGPRLLRLGMLRRHADRLADAQERLREKGGWAVFFGRFTAFLRAVMPGIAGASRMPWSRFARFNLLGALIWGAGVTLVGYAVGGSYEKTLPWLGRSSIGALAAFGLVVVWLWHRRRNVSHAEARPRPESAPDPGAARSEPCRREPVRSP
jgi:membrane protein DedA with SNARE-associated domain